MTAPVSQSENQSFLDALPRVVAALVSLSALGYFAGWREAKAYYTGLGAPWASAMLSPQSLLQLSATTMVVVLAAAFLSLQILLESKLSLRKVDWACGLALLGAAICLFASQGQIGGISSLGAFALATVGSYLCAIAAGLTLTQLYFTLKNTSGKKLVAGHLWLVYWFVLPGLFWAPDRLGQARAQLDSDLTSSPLPTLKLAQGPNAGESWRFVHLASDKALLLRQDAAGKLVFKLVEGKDIDSIGPAKTR